MEQTSVKDQIKKLVEIQKIDFEIYENKEFLKEKPLEIEELKQEFESKKKKLNDLENQVKDVQLKRKEIELDLQKKEEQIAKSNADLNSLKTNKEYTAKVTEIEGLKADKSRFEEKILLSYDEVDKVNVAMEEEKGVVAEEEKNFQSKKSEVEAQLKDVEQKVNALEQEREKLLPGIEKNIREKYEKLLSHKEGLAIVPVVSGNSCGGCYMNITNQMINQMKIAEDYVQCEVCSRILYIEDLL